MSSTEEEYVAATTVACHAAWLRRLLKYMGHTPKYPTSIFCDNNSAIQLSKHNLFHRKSKHIDTRYHFIHELINEKQNSLLFCDCKGRISGATNAHQAWNLLASAYKETDRVKTVRLQTLHLQFESLKMKESESIDLFMTMVSGLVT